VKALLHSFANRHVKKREESNISIITKIDRKMKMWVALLRWLKLEMRKRAKATVSH